MNGRIKAGLALVVIGALAGGVLLFSETRSRPSVTVTFRVSVTPSEQSDFVARRANSARFKYMMGKIAGVKPFLALRLSGF